MVVSADPASGQTAEAYAFADLSDVGDASLMRNDNGIIAQANIEGAAPGVYTMWTLTSRFSHPRQRRKTR